MSSLEIKEISAGFEGKKILDNISFDVNSGEVLVIMGPNGAGKSTISNVIMNNDKYEKYSGKILLDSVDLTNKSTEEIAREGVFMSFQHPVEIDGVTMSNFLRTSYNSLKGTNYKMGEFHKVLNEKMKILDMSPKFRTRFVNSGFSGGEKKRSEVLQLLLFEPKFAILDEIDSGLDVDALKVIGNTIKKVKEEYNTGFIIITHHSRILEYLDVDKVVVLKDGKVFREGGSELVDTIINKGFNS